MNLSLQTEGFEAKARRILAECYGLAPATLHPLNFTGAVFKDVCRVEAGGTAYVLKRYRSDFRSGQDLTAIHQAQEYLMRKGLPVAPVLPDREGRLVTGDGGHCWVLYAWVEGRHQRPEQIPDRRAALLGATLARLDLELGGWETDWPGAEPFYALLPAESIARFEELLRLAERGSGPRDQLAVQVLRYRIEALDRLAPLAPRIIPMERQWVHGDPNEGNFLWEGDRITAIIDFDNMRWAPRGFDFMYALTSHFPSGSPAREAFARAYLGAVRPTPAELELYAPMWAYTQLCDIWPIDELYLRPANFHPSWEIDPPSDRWERQIGPLTDWLLRLQAAGPLS
ncbi:MAG: phosphotransferase enzyme family protein [Bacillota bacterium]